MFVTGDTLRFLMATYMSGSPRGYTLFPRIPLLARFIVLPRPRARLPTRSTQWGFSALSPMPFSMLV